MPELRKDPVVDRWVIISTQRDKRPSDFIHKTGEKKDQLSPFSPNNESMTPPEVYAVRPENTLPNTPGWSLRVIPNKYPALEMQESLDRRGEGLYDMISGIGAHEVIVETPDKDLDIADLTLTQIQDIFRAYQQRMLDLKKDTRLKYVMIYKNKGFDAGATLRHAHSQLIATPIVPKRVSEELDGAKTYFNLKERCVFCDIIHQETQSDTRVVLEEDHFIVLSPFAARFPFETWILPKSHTSHYEDIEDLKIANLAVTIKKVFQKLNTALKSPSYNLVIHTAPLQEVASECYHWHIEIIPKLTRIAGFEWGSGFYINPTSPEEAAQYLKDVFV